MNAPFKIAGVLGADSDAGEAVQVIATPEQLFAWAQRAKQGERFVYATRCFLPPKNAGASAARNLQQRGLVNLCQRTISGRMSGERNYEAQRTSKPWPGDHPSPRDRSGNLLPIDDEARATNEVLALLERAAQFGRPCPTDAQLAKQCGIKVSDVAVTMDALRACEAIRVKPVRAPTCRIVTIVESGRQTGEAR